MLLRVLLCTFSTAVLLVSSAFAQADVTKFYVTKGHQAEYRASNAKEIVHINTWTNAQKGPDSAASSYFFFAYTFEDEKVYRFFNVVGTVPNSDISASPSHLSINIADLRTIEGLSWLMYECDKATDIRTDLPFPAQPVPVKLTFRPVDEQPIARDGTERSVTVLPDGTIIVTTIHGSLVGSVARISGQAGAVPLPLANADAVSSLFTSSFSGGIMIERNPPQH